MHTQSTYGLKKIKLISPKRPITEAELQLVHPPEFVEEMHTSKIAVCRATEVPILACIPMFVIRNRLITPMKWQTGGSVLAGYIALQKGYCIHLGGGFHHCSATRAGGFCMFADITLIYK